MSADDKPIMGVGIPAAHPDPDKVVASGFGLSVMNGKLHTLTIQAQKITDPRVVGIRWVIRQGYDGPEKVLQFATSWVRGWESGIDWADVPEITL